MGCDLAADRSPATCTRPSTASTSPIRCALTCHKSGVTSQVLDRQAHQEFGVAINPQLVAGELSGRLPDDTILTTDSGSATTWWAPPPQAPAWDASLSVGHPVHHGPRRAPHHDRPLRSAYCVGRISVSVATARRKAAWATGLLSMRQF
jgi:hypothetical protein